jgi:hypothetical protein
MTTLKTLNSWPSIPGFALPLLEAGDLLNQKPKTKNPEPSIPGFALPLLEAGDLLPDHGRGQDIRRGCPKDFRGYGLRCCARLDRAVSLGLEFTYFWYMSESRTRP